MKLYYGSEIAEFSFPRFNIWIYSKVCTLIQQMLNINIPNEPNIFKVHMHEKVAKKWTTASWALVCNTHLFSCLATPWGFGPPFWSVLSSCLTSRKPGTWSHVLMWLSRSSLIASIPPRSARSGKCFYS